MTNGQLPQQDLALKIDRSDFNRRISKHIYKIAFLNMYIYICMYSCCARYSLYVLANNESRFSVPKIFGSEEKKVQKWLRHPSPLK